MLDQQRVRQCRSSSSSSAALERRAAPCKTTKRKRRKTVTTAATSLAFLLALSARVHGEVVAPAPSPSLVERPSPRRRDLQGNSPPWAGRPPAGQPPGRQDDTLPFVFSLAETPAPSPAFPFLPPGIIIATPVPDVATSAPSPPTTPTTGRPPVYLGESAEPSVSPTAAQTAAPIAMPSRLPSDGPSLVPTGGPSRAPSPAPTVSPSQPPTKAPTLPPTAGPTRAPSARPSAAPTANPTAQPTVSPSAAPSPKPSSSPSHMPAGLPSAHPSAEPTPETPKPTISYAPTGTPSASPTLAPSVTPSLAPSPEPSVAPSPGPTESPSNMPTLTDQEAIVPLEMTLMSTAGQLKGRTIFDYQGATAGHIKQTTKSMNLDLVPDSLKVIVNIQKQVARNATTGTRVRRRDLQTASYWLTVTSNVLVTFKSPTVYSPLQWVSESFNSPDKRDLYITRLKQSSPDFNGVDSIGLLVDGFVPIEVPEEQDPDDDGGVVAGIDLPIIIGAAAAGAVLVALLIFFLLRRSGSGSSNVNANQQKSPLPSTAASTGETPLRVSTEICVQQQDDISTLGDPHLGGMAVANAADAVDRDERTASVGDDYDYAKEYLLHQQQGAGGMLADPAADTSSRSRLTSTDSAGKVSTATPFTRVGSGPMGASVFSDDASFEQQYSDQPYQGQRFEVVVPPGKLGMVIDTPHGGVPVVHAIKAESVLSEKVKVGDRLVSVDDEDVTRMTAVQVSKLISLKSREQRILVFVRNPRQDR